MKTNIKEKLAYSWAFVLAGGFLAWWLFNYFVADPSNTRSSELYSDTYWVVGVIGIVCGLFAAKEWGGFKSIFGRSLMLFSLGLAAQVFGQITYSYYALVEHVEAPYPSIGDIGFFGSIILYIVAVLLLLKAVGVKFRTAPASSKLIAAAIPAALLIASYTALLKGYEFSGDKLITVLDFGYPLGQAFYISLALLAYILSLKSLGGRMKNKILLLIFALTVQYAADFLFLYRLSNDHWYPGDISDMVYQLAYLFMTLAMLQIGGVARSLRAPKS